MESFDNLSDKTSFDINLDADDKEERQNSIERSFQLVISEYQ